MKFYNQHGDEMSAMDVVGELLYFTAKASIFLVLFMTIGGALLQTFANAYVEQIDKLSVSCQNEIVALVKDYNAR